MTRAKVLEGEHLKTGDQEPDLLVQLIKDNRVPKDLSSVNEVEVHLAEANSSTTLATDDTTGRVSIEAASDGKVSYQWQSSDTDTAATLVGEFVVVDSNSEQATYPNEGSFKVYIEEGIA